MKAPLEKKLSEIETLIPHYQLENHSTSKVNVGWQIAHSLKVINMIAVALEKSESSQMKKRFNLLKLILFNWGSFPRGAKAPKRVRPIDDEITVENISSELNKAKMNIKKLYELPKGAYIEHPKFGVLNTEESITFLNIHTEHHLKIAREIIKKSTIK